ncbi:MAG: Nif3-like dinuclear metal center hexameric protein [Planctomycetota bacterium]
MSRQTSPRVADVARAIEEFTPLSLAEASDRVGLRLVPRLRDRAPVRRVLLSLDCDLAAVRAAERRKAQLIVSHHPPALPEGPCIEFDSPAGRLLSAALRARVSLYCAHTNLDSAKGGTADRLCDLLRLRDVRPLIPKASPSVAKLVAFVPESDLDRVRSALSAAGAGVIGEYTECSWRTLGTGAFRASRKARPTLGRRGKLEEVSEYRLEVVLPQSLVGDAVRALKAAHSYEEPAFDIYPLVPPSAGAGAGRIGVLDPPCTLPALVRRLKRLFRIRSARVTPGGPRTIRLLALCPGSGGSLLEAAASAGAHAFLTGEIRYHHALDAKDRRISVIECGHYTTEAPILPVLRALLKKRFPSLVITTFSPPGEPFILL